MPNTGIDWTEIPFTKSSYSYEDEGKCVEVAVAGDRVAIRHSKLAPHGPILELSVPAFTAFLATIHTITDAYPT